MKSFLLIFVCCAVVGIALVGIGRMVYTVIWNVRIVNYRQALSASMKHAEEKNCMRIAVDDDEDVAIRFDEVASIHHYLANHPIMLPVSNAKDGKGAAVIDCGDGSTLEVREAGERKMLLYYQAPGGKTYRYALQYQTVHDGWDAFLRIVSGEYRPGG